MADQRGGGTIRGGLAGAGPPLPALPPVAGRNARLIGIVFFETVERSGIEAEALHQGAGRKSAFKKFIRREEGESLILGQGWQAGESQMQLREKLFAAAPEVQGFSHDIEDLRGYDAPKGRREQSQNTRLLAATRSREQGAGAKHETFVRHFQIRAKPVRATPLGKSRFQIVKINHQTLRETES